MKVFKRYSFLVLVLLFLSSCASVFTGTSDSITFNTTPEGAKVLDGGIEKCTTPCTVDISRSLSKKTVLLKKDGYEDKVIGLSSKFNTVSVFNIFGGLIPWAIDLATGAVKKYDVKVYDVELERK